MLPVYFKNTKEEPKKITALWGQSKMNTESAMKIYFIRQFCELSQFY